MTDEPSNAALSALMFPDTTGSNPYQHELCEGLRDNGVAVELSGYGYYSPLVRAVLERGRPDVVHLHWLSKCFVTESSMVTMLLGIRLLVELTVLRALGIGAVWTVHNRTEHERRSPRVELAIKTLAVRLLTDIVVHCESAADVVGETFHLTERQHRKVTVVPHGSYVHSYPNEVDAEAARAEFGYGPDETVFCFFGMIRPYKNVRQLIETFQEITVPDARLLIAGNPVSDDLAKAVRDAAAEDDRVQVHLEFVPDEAVQLYMNAADVVVLSYEDVFTSGSAILAMSFSCPLVVPRVGCIGELLDGLSNHTYDSNAPDGLLNAMKATMDADLEQIGEHNRDRIERLDWDAIARRTRSVYDHDDRAHGG